MQIPVLLEKIDGNGYRAQEMWRLREGAFFSAEGATREEALENLRAELCRRLPPDTELVNLELDLPEADALREENARLKEQVAKLTEDPWAKVKGIYKDDPLFDEWQQAIEEYRKERDRDEVPE